VTFRDWVKDGWWLKDGSVLVGYSGGQAKTTKKN